MCCIIIIRFGALALENACGSENEWKQNAISKLQRSKYEPRLPLEQQGAENERREDEKQITCTQNYCYYCYKLAGINPAQAIN